MLKIFTVYDSKAEAFIQPFFSPATGAAIRSFEQAANEEGHDFQRYAADYTLFELGVFSPLSGEIQLLDSMLNLGLALTFQKRDMPRLTTPLHPHDETPVSIHRTEKGIS